jgi:dihydroorotate dehydrogenase (fumarate)
VKINLTTTYLGLALSSPIVASASPLNDRIDVLKRLEEAGAGAAVFPSLFQEQIEHDEIEINRFRDFGAESFGEALDYFPEMDTYNTGPDSYLRAIEAAKSAVSIPIIASLNGTSRGGWESFARLIESRGADALELNILDVETDPNVTSGEFEQRAFDLISAVRSAISIPLAVKIGPYFSAPANFARRAVEAGADGLVLFNRYLHPDIDIERMAVTPELELSQPSELRLVLRWIAILRGQNRASLAATGGIHSATDAIKALMAGADVAMMASALLLRGPEHVSTVLREMTDWLVEHEYRSVRQLTGSMSRHHCPDPNAYERANYLRALTSFTGRQI